MSLKERALSIKTLHTKSRSPKEGAPKGFYSLEKIGIVGSNIGYAVFSCLAGISTTPTQL